MRARCRARTCFRWATRAPVADQPPVRGLGLPGELALGLEDGFGLTAGQQMPEEHRQLAGGSGRSDLRPAPGTNALDEGAQRPGVSITFQATSPSMWRGSEAPAFEMRP
jgi:hypothetical protein